MGHERRHDTEATPSGDVGAAFGKHYGRIEAYCMRRLDADEARDAAAEVFAIAWRRRADAPGTERVLPWLYSIARNVVANSRRSRRRRRRLSERLLRTSNTAAPGADVQVVASEEHRLVIEAALLLSESDREILALAGWEELSNRDIGLVLGCSTDAAAQRVHRAKKRLGAHYRQLAGPDAPNGRGKSS
jgi:RNA polymerase sigma-70 factor (ECF subfamily)